VRGLPLLGGHTATSRLSILWPVVRAAAICVVALVVGGLFASGDAISGSWAGRHPAKRSFSGINWWINSPLLSL
jgi:hypothetical protein